MKNLIMVENIIKDMKYDLIAIDKNLMTPRRLGKGLKDEVVLVDEVPYKVTTDMDCRIKFITAITEVDQVDLKTNLALKIKFDMDKEYIDCIEIPKLLNINKLKDMHFREFVDCYKVRGF